MARPGGKSKGGAPRPDPVSDLERDAARELGGRRGPPVGPGNPGGDGGGAPTPPADGGHPAGAGPLRSEVVLDAARSLRGKVVDALGGYHQAGYLITGHKHWKDIPQDRRVAAADPIAEAIVHMPAAAQASILQGLAWSSLVLVAAEMLVAPAVVSYKLKREERKAAAEKKSKEEAAARGADQQ